MAKPPKKAQIASLDTLSRDELAFLLQNLDKMPLSEQEFLLKALEGDAEAERVAKCQDNLMEYMQTVAPNHVFGVHHKKIAATLDAVVRGEKKRVIINIAPRHGKLIADETPVLTTDGWKTHGALRCGDKVFSPSGKPVEVVAESPPGVANVRMEFFDGSVVYCHENHEWTLYSATAQRTKTVEANYFLTSRNGGMQKKVSSGHRALYFLPPVAPLETGYKHLICDPHVRMPKKRRIGLKHVTRVEEGRPGKCIQVDSEDGLYLVGRELIPTHNSELASYLFPSWFIGKKPDKKIIIASHTAELATGFGRRVRNLMDTPEYRSIFEKVHLSSDSKAAGRWATNDGGEFYACGIGGALAGRGGDLILIDDPVSEQDAKTGSTQVFLDQWEWFQQGLMTRLMPGGSCVVLMCMTGDTRVRMAGGGEKRLDKISVGDEVATYDNGELTTTRVVEFQSSGVDAILTVTTRSGIILRANERHPFLVDFEGERKWMRVRELRVGMSLVATKAAVEQRDHKIFQGCATHARQENHTTRPTPTPHTIHLDTTANTEEKNVSTKDVAPQQRPRGTAYPTTGQLSGTAENDTHHAHRRRDVATESKVDMGSRKKILMICCKLKAMCAQFVSSHHLNTIPERTGTTNYVSTTTMPQGKSEGFFATTATSPSDTQKLRRQRELSPNTSPFTTDPIVSITSSGREEVFDVQIERTENFIANGVVSHNTRWSKLDLTGQIINHMTKNPEADQWEVIELPAVLPSAEPLWPEFWTKEELEKKRIAVGPAAWAAQYMQQPSSEGAQLLKKEWWKHWDKEEPPECVYTIMSLDAAQEAHNRADYSAVTHWGVFYIDGPDGNKQTNVILLDAWRDRLEFPDLKRAVLADYKERKPDTFIVEKKSNGAALYQELRRMDISVTEFTPSRGQDKIARVNAISDMFASGVIWAPTDRRWAQDVIEECAEFPLGANDDFADSTTQAMFRIRQGGFLTLPSDYEDNEMPEFRRKGRSYY